MSEENNNESAEFNKEVWEQEMLPRIKQALKLLREATKIGEGERNNPVGCTINISSVRGLPIQVKFFDIPKEVTTITDTLDMASNLFKMAQDDPAKLEEVKKLLGGDKNEEGDEALDNIVTGDSISLKDTGKKKDGPKLSDVSFEGDVDDAIKRMLRDGKKEDMGNA